MNKLAIALVVAVLAGCSAPKAETKSDEKVVEEETTETTETAGETDLASTVVASHRAYSSGDVEGTMKHFAEGATWTQVGAESAEGKEAIRALLFDNLKGMMSDLAVAPRRIFVDEDANIAIYQGVIKGTNDGPVGDRPATNKMASNDYVHVAWFDDEGKIKELHAISNGTTIPMMLGVMPTPEGQPSAAASDWPQGEPEIVQAEDNPEGMAVVEATMEASINGDVEAYIANWSPEVTGNNYGAHWMGFDRDMLHNWMKAMQNAFTEMTPQTKGDWAFGEYLVGYYTVKMKHSGDYGPMKATNKMVEVTLLDIARVEDGQIVWLDSYSNPLELMGQLAPPKPTDDEETAMKR